MTSTIWRHGVGCGYDGNRDELYEYRERTVLQRALTWWNGRSSRPPSQSSR